MTPEYPEIARLGRVQGVVVIDGFVGTDGRLEDLTVKSGHPVLIEAALDCVRQWEYEPALLNGVATRSGIEISVRFVLTTDSQRHPDEGRRS